VVRELVKYPERQNEILGSVFLLKLSGGCLALAAVVIVSAIMKPEDNLTRLIIAIVGLGLIVQSFNAIDLWFRSIVASKYTVLSQNSSFILASVAKVVLILKRASLLAFVIVNLAQTILSAIGLIFFYKKNGKSLIKWRPVYSVAVSLIKESWPLIFAGLAIAIYMKIDQIMLGEMIGKKAVGTYTAAVRLSEIWYFIPVAIASSLLPAIVKSKQHGEKIYKNRIQKFYDLNAILAYALSIPTAFLAPFIIRVLYGDAYAGTETIFAIHIWACLFVFLGVARGQYLVNEGLLKFYFFATAVGAIVNLSLNFILIPRYEGVGAAIATVFSYGASGYLSSFVYPRLFETGVMQSKAFIAPIKYLIVFGKAAYAYKKN
jgi:PST family polysaccharide transporter